MTDGVGDVDKSPTIGRLVFLPKTMAKKKPKPKKSTLPYKPQNVLVVKFCEHPMVLNFAKWLDRDRPLWRHPNGEWGPTFAQMDLIRLYGGELTVPDANRMVDYLEGWER